MIAAVNGTIRQAVRAAAGKFGKALRSTASTTGSQSPTRPASPLDLTTGMTRRAWVNPSVMSGWETILMKERGAAGAGLLAFALYAHDGAPLARTACRSGGIRARHPVVDVTDRARAWRDDAATEHVDAHRHDLRRREHALLRQRRPGRTAPPTRVTSSPSNGALRIGGNNSRRRAGEFFKGLIDEVRVYNRALSAAEITADMKSPVVR